VDGVVTVYTRQFREVVPRPCRDDAERGVAITLQQPIGNFMHGPVAAQSHDMACSLTHRLGGELLGVARPLGAEHVDGPSLGSKRP
jgi:hypothetical protein